MVTTTLLPERVSEVAFEKLHHATLDELIAFQMKVTYIGEQRKPLPTIVIYCDLVEGDARQSCRRVLSMKVRGLDFGNDELTPMFCQAPPPDLSAVLDNLSRLPAIVTAGKAAKYDLHFPGKYLAVSLCNKVDGEEIELQAVLGQPDAVPLLDALGRALRHNTSCRDALFILWRGLGFHIGALDPDSDEDGASDGREASWGTNPLRPDSDNDGIQDSDEILAGTDPLNAFHDNAPDYSMQVTDGPFRGSQVTELTTMPDFLSGVASLELQYTPDRFRPKTDNLVFVQVFRRSAVKADGFTIPILPSLYIEYAGSPELDLHTIDGATVDHKVGELDPYYNGRDPQDRFTGAIHKQSPGLIADSVRPTRMVYRCRTYEEHWRALNPEGVRAVKFDYETAAFAENGPGKGYFLGCVNWSWGKRRAEAVFAGIGSSHSVTGDPTAEVVVANNGHSATVPVFLRDDPGQPSRFFFDVLALWIRNHKFEWPGQSVDLPNGLRIVVPQPISVSTRLSLVRAQSVSGAPSLPGALKLTRVGCELNGTDISGSAFPWDYNPFALPITLTIQYSADDLRGFSRDMVGVARYDDRLRRYTTRGLYVLRHDQSAQAMTFCTSHFGKFALFAKG